MKPEFPTPAQIPQLRRLWKAAFGDEDAFLDDFFSTGFRPERCRCIAEDDKLLAALYWFDGSCQGERFAYLYAIATDPGCRNRGLCRALVEDTKALLQNQGYAGALLVPQDEGLRQMYRRMGFETCTYVSEITCTTGDTSAELRRVVPEEYARLRRKLQPEDGVIQEGDNLTFLATQAEFYAGAGWVAAATVMEERLHCHEFLGDATVIPGFLRAVGCGQGFFRLLGREKEFAMLCPLTPDCSVPGYFGLAFD